MTDDQTATRSDEPIKANREFLTPGMAIFIPLIIGSAVLVVAILASHRFVASQQEQEARQRLEKARVLLRQSLDYMKADNYEDAERAASAAVKLVPDLATAYIFRAEALANLSRHEEAIKDYSISLTLEPDMMDSYNAYYGRGIVHARLGMHEMAVKDFTEALKLQKHRAEGYISRAASRKRLGDMDGYEQDLQRARELGRIVNE